MKKNVFFTLLKITTWIALLGRAIGFILFIVIGVSNICQHEVWEGVKAFANALTDLMFAGLMGAVISLIYSPDEEDAGNEG